VKADRGGIEPHSASWNTTQFTPTTLNPKRWGNGGGEQSNRARRFRGHLKGEEIRKINSTRRKQPYHSIKKTWKEGGVSVAGGLRIEDQKKTFERRRQVADAYKGNLFNYHN